MLRIFKRVLLIGGIILSNLELKIRDKNIPNSAKKSRKNGNIPGVLYGKAINNLMFEVGDL